MSAKVIPATKIPKNLKILSVAKNSGRTFSYLPVSALAGSDVTDISCAATASSKWQKSVFDFSCRYLDIRDSWLSTSWSISWDVKYGTQVNWLISAGRPQLVASGCDRSLSLTLYLISGFLIVNRFHVKYVTSNSSELTDISWAATASGCDRSGSLT